MTATELKQATSDYQKQIAAEYVKAGKANPFNKTTYNPEAQNKIYLESRDLYFGLRDSSDSVPSVKDGLRLEYFALKLAHQRGLI